MIIAIDGPSGAGKSTLGKMLAQKLNLLYLDTGAMYRAVGLAVLQAKLSPKDRKKTIEIARNADIKFIGEPDNSGVFLNGKDVSLAIRTSDLGQIASKVSAISEVRKILVDRQRQLGEDSENGAVLDGRDIGTVVFPNADIKFFLTAKPEARAKRRYMEELENGHVTTHEKTLAEITKRDKRDANRKDSPLKTAKDAIVIDTSEMNEKETLKKMLEEISMKTQSFQIPDFKSQITG